MAAADLALVILAAGEGTRMRSRLPKVLHPVCGRPILLHTVQLAREIGAKRIVAVIGHGADQVREALVDQAVETVVQAEQRGTAHAALQTRALLADHPGPVLVMNGDHPLYRPETFAEFLDVFRTRSAELALLVAEAPDPSGYGRVVRGADGRVLRIVEERDASADERALREVNLGAYLAEAGLLFPLLERIGDANRAGEFYLTDLVALALAEGRRVETSSAAWDDALGINSRVELAQAEARLRARIAEHWMREGVTLIDPAHTYIDVDVEIGSDTVLAPGVMLRGSTRIGAGCRVDEGCVVESSAVGDDTWLKPHCRLMDAEVGADCELGPSAHLRPGAALADGCRVGNFVEVKNSRLGRGTKADHLSYIGDADLGAGVTIGCGAITVNYDGEKKHRTAIGDGAFVGCNANLIAPVEIAAGAYVAAGSTVTQPVPADALAVARARQRNIEGWRARRFGPREED